MSKNKDRKQKRWRPFSGLFKRSPKETVEDWSQPKPVQDHAQIKVGESGSEDGFVIEESDESVTEIEMSTTDIFVPESALKEYAVLGLDDDVSDAKLKRRYRILVKENHPDNGGDPKEFMKIQKAYKKIMKYRGNN